MRNIFLILLSTLFLFSCQPTKTIIDTSCSGYKNIDFSRQALADEGIGIMPVLGGDEKEQYRRPTGDALTKYFREAFGDSKVMSTSQVITTLNDNDLADEYTQALSGYTVSGIVPKNLIAKLGDALGARYLLYTRLLADSEVGQISTGSYTSTSLQVDEVYVQTQVWDTQLGDVVWEGKGGCSKFQSNDADVIDELAKGLANVVGKEKGQGPCEEKGDLIKSYQEAVTNTYLAATGVSLAFSLLILLAL